jgi:hypothetical protein
MFCSFLKWVSYLETITKHLLGKQLDKCVLSSESVIIIEPHTVPLTINTYYNGNGNLLYNTITGRVNIGVVFLWSPTFCVILA